MSNPRFDFVVVGGGTAGCVLASRLSENGQYQVLLVEAGIDTPEHNTPADIANGLEPWLPRIGGPHYFWPELSILRTAAHPQHPRSPLFFEQAKILGGGSSINMVVSNRGLPQDYDEWQSAGAEGWDWQGVLPYFRKLEHDADYGDDALHGNAGPVPIARVREDNWNPFTQAAAAALDAIGLHNIHDQNAVFEDGYFPPAFTLKGDQRFSSARAYLGPTVRQRRNLTIWTETTFEKLLFEGKRVTGVQVHRAGQAVIVDTPQVVLSAGALQTPAILQRAGIGPAALLTSLGIEVLADRPGVGQNLWDHSSLAVVGILNEQDRQDASIERATLRHQFGIRFSSGVDRNTPSDLYSQIIADPASGLVNTVFWVNKPASRGALQITSADPGTYPAVDFNLLSDQRDIDRLIAALRTASRLYAQAPLAAYGLKLRLSRFGFADLDGPALDDILDDTPALEAWIRNHVGGVWHPAGTARIGRADDRHAVVDSGGQVIGVTGLAVADASVMPTIPRANINLPILMIAEKIAEAILQRHQALSAA